MSAAAQPAKQGIVGSLPTRVRFLIYPQILNSVVFGYFMTYLSAYLGEADVSDAWRVGLILGPETIVFILTGIPIGIFSDKKGRKWFLMFGNSLMNMAVYLLGIGVLNATFRRIKPRG